jgi:hypothetical protein
MAADGREGELRRWLRKLRGIVGLGALGGVGGAVFGAAWSVVEFLMLGSPAPSFLTVAIWSAGLWAVSGAAAASGLGVLLATFGSNKTLSELHAWQGGVGGAIAGAGAPVAIAFALTGTLPPWMMIAPAIGLAIAVGGGLGHGLVATAKRAEARELAVVAEVAALSDGN